MPLDSLHSDPSARALLIIPHAMELCDRQPALIKMWIGVATFMCAKMHNLKPDEICHISPQEDITDALLNFHAGKICVFGGTYNDRPTQEDTDRLKFVTIDAQVLTEQRVFPRIIENLLRDRLPFTAIVNTDATNLALCRVDLLNSIGSGSIVLHTYGKPHSIRRTSLEL